MNDRLLMKLLWLTDLHLDRVDENRRLAFCDSLKKNSADAVVITGDISTSEMLPGHLLELGRACAPRPVYFVLGNHDFIGSSFADVDRAVERVCAAQNNLRHLGHGEIVSLGGEAALIGCRGWPDGRAGWGSRSVVKSPDCEGIADFRGLSKPAVFERMEDLGKASARYFRETLPYALQCYRHVWIATHVPPFTQAAFYDGKPCGRHHLPHFTNWSAGSAIQGIARNYPKNRITVLCGHTHSGAVVDIAEGLEVRAGSARPGRPMAQRSFEINSMTGAFQLQSR